MWGKKKKNQEFGSDSHYTKINLHIVTYHSSLLTAREFVGWDFHVLIVSVNTEKVGPTARVGQDFSFGRGASAYTIQEKIDEDPSLQLGFMIPLLINATDPAPISCFSLLDSCSHM